MMRSRSSRRPSRAGEMLRTWSTSLILLPLCAYVLLQRGDYTAFDAFSLVIHEAGHLIFAPFGEFLRMAGGTLVQILLPGLVAGFYLVHNHLVGTQLGLFWLGQNFVNISVYAADARAQVLPLVGPPGARHDWHFLLGKLGLLPHDTLVGHAFVALAAAAFVVLLALPRRM